MVIQRLRLLRLRSRAIRSRSSSVRALNPDGMVFARLWNVSRSMWIAFLVLVGATGSAGRVERAGRVDVAARPSADAPASGEQGRGLPVGARPPPCRSAAAVAPPNLVNTG